MEVDHDLVLVDEFDALSIQVKEPQVPLVKKQKFPAKTHARKVAGELQAASGLVYLPGQSSKTFDDSDVGQPFRQHRYFYYLSGADFPNCFVTYDIARDNLVLWIPYTDPRQVLWYGSTPTIDECKARFDVDDVRYAQGLDRFLLSTLNPVTPLFVLHAEQAPRLDRVRGPVQVDAARLRPAVDAARVVKTDYEVSMIRRANAVSSAAHRAVLQRVNRLTNEREIEALFRGYCTARGARRQAYPVIVGSGTNAASLHYDDNDQPLAGKQMVVVDAGCEWDCYASDITRTLPIGGALTAEGKAVYALVERMQAECIDRVRPGVAFYALHLHAHSVAVRGLLELGILRGGSPRDIFLRGTAAAFFPHGLGHHVGLEVHDVSGRERLLLPAAGGKVVGRGPGGGSGAGGKREWLSPEMLSCMCRDATLALTSPFCYTHPQRPPPPSSSSSPSQPPSSSLPPPLSSASSPPGAPYHGRQKLEKNMVVTVEPGIYFCREYIEAFFLANPAHAKFIDRDVLEKYYPVGGVRIEDDILVVEGGYENLTTAPKGEEAWKIMNAG